MSPWKVTFTPTALKELSKCSDDTRKAIGKAIRRFCTSGDGDIKKLQDKNPPTWRLRVGNWRVLFHKDAQSRTIVVVAIRDRKESY